MTISEQIDYLFSKINWGASAMDAQAVQIMNTLKASIEQEKQQQWNEALEAAAANVKGHVEWLSMEAENINLFEGVDYEFGISRSSILSLKK